MAIDMTCPNGHRLKVKDELAGKTGLCPQCHVRVHIPKPGAMSDDDIMAALGPSVAGPDRSPTDSSIHAGDASNTMEQSGIVPVGSSSLQRKKTCPQCGGQASMAFRHCPRCGTPLPVEQHAAPRKPGAK